MDLDKVAEFLFEKEKSQDLLKMLYKGIPDEKYKGDSYKFAFAACSSIPGQLRENLPFAYSLALSLEDEFLGLSNEDHGDTKNEESDNQCESEEYQNPQIDTKLAQVMDQFGFIKTPSGWIEQDELMEESLEDAVVLIKGLMAGKSGNADNQIAKECKKIHALSKRLQKTLTNVSAVANSLVKGLNKIKSEWSESGIDYGRDLSKLDSSQYAYLATPESKKLFMLKLAKGELLQESSIDKKGLGDLIIAIDTSGSTEAKTKQGYRVIDLELGLSVGIARLANQNKCKSLIIPYDNNPYNQSEWLKGKEQINAYFANMLNGKKLRLNGGTEFNNALQCIINILKENKYPAKRKPGIIFITDGYDEVSDKIKDDINQLKAFQGIKLYSYFVSNNDPRKYSQDLISISDSSFWVDSNLPVEDQISNFTQLV
jgi:hypothetical protein